MSLLKAASIARDTLQAVKLRITLDQDQKYSRRTESQTLPGVQSRAMGCCPGCPLGAGGPLQQPGVLSGLSRWAGSMSAVKFPIYSREVQTEGKKLHKAI